MPSRWPFIGSLPFEHLGQGQPYRFQRIEVPLRDLNDQALMAVSRSGQLALSLAEMKTIKRHFALAGSRAHRLRARDPGPDLERALLAQDVARPDFVSKGARLITCSSKRSFARPMNSAATGW